MNDGLNTLEKIVLSLGKLYASYGYNRYNMCKFEEYDTYVTNKDFLLSSNCITFNDTNGKLMALKPDVTLSIVKKVPDEKIQVAGKVYYNENVYRVSAGTKCFKEIMQTGLECIGNVSDYHTFEVLLMAKKSLALISDRYVLDISHMGLLATLFSVAGLSETSAQKMLSAFKMKNANAALSVIKEDNVSEYDKNRILTLLNMNETASNAVKILNKTFPEPEFGEILKELNNVLTPLNDDSVKVDFSAINDMKYYNGIVFRGYIDNVPRAVLSGGCYDALMKKMGKDNRAIGFAIYTDELNTPEQEDYDNDVLLLINENVDIKEVNDTVNELIANGENVNVQTTLPFTLRFKRIIDARR